MYLVIRSPLIIILFFVGCYSTEFEKGTSQRDIIGIDSNQSSPRKIRDDESREDYYQFIVSSKKYTYWKNNYPEETLHAVLDFPVEKIDGHLVDVFRCFLNFNFNIATDFIEEEVLEPHHKDIAIEVIVRSLQVDDLGMAVLWAQDINDDTKRHSLIEELATH